MPWLGDYVGVSTIIPPEFVNVTVFVQNGSGPVVRQKYLEGSGIYGCVCMDQDYTGNALDVNLALAKAAGSTRETYLTKHCSRTAEFAVRTVGPRVINTEEIRKVFEETESGVFARNWLTEFSQGMPVLHRLRRDRKNSDMEKTRELWRKTFGKESN